MKPDHIREFTLDNGLRVIINPGDFRTVSGKLIVHQGAMHEKDGEDGIAHFLEHVLVSAGSGRFSPNHQARAQDELGAHNASTGTQATTFPGDMIPENLELYLDLTASSVFAPHYATKQINEERGRVLQEIDDSYGAFAFPAQARAEEILFGKYHPRCRKTLGRKEVVLHANARELEAFRSRGYHPNNMELILAGKIPSNMESLVEKYFGHADRGERTIRRVPKVQPLEGIHHIEYPVPTNGSGETTSASIAMSMSGPRDQEEGYCPARMLAMLLGSGRSSDLSTEIGKGLGVYSIGASFRDSYDYGFLEVQASVNPRNVDLIFGAMFDRFRHAQEELFDSDRLRRVKKKLTYASLYRLDALAGQFSNAELYGAFNYGLDDFIDGMNEVTLPQVREAARRILPSSAKEGNYLRSVWSPLIEKPNF